MLPEQIDLPTAQQEMGFRRPKPGRMLERRASPGRPLPEFGIAFAQIVWQEAWSNLDLHAEIVPFFLILLLAMAGWMSFSSRFPMAEDKQENQPPRKKFEELTFQDGYELSRYVTDTGKILPRRITRLTAKQQRHLTRLIKRGRNMLTVK